ncbi:MAG: MOSC domain-containing protein [Treponema sp.]|nr:MOSC domain-containing protein [Treponema sp.]
MGKIVAVCISEKKGTVKNDKGSCRIIENFGLEHDAHAGSERQVSLLSAESVEAFRQKTNGEIPLPPGVFGENLLVSGIPLTLLPIGTRLRTGTVLLEMTQIGKKCHTGCEIAKRAGECIMPHEGVFAKVLSGGVVKNGDTIEVLPDEQGKKQSAYTAAIITVSDRSFRGEREDASGPVLAEELTKAGYTITETLLLPDEEEDIAAALIRICDTQKPAVIFTTGGTGFSVRDCTPEATLKVAERNAPGIAEAIRAESMKITPHAMLSRAVSVIRGRTIIINLPGSPKAVKESLAVVLPALAHGILILLGEADG